MTNHDGTESDARQLRMRRMVRIGAVALLAAGLVVGVAIVNSDNNSEGAPSGQVADSVQAGNLNRACVGWMVNNPNTVAGAPMWCADMIAWMTQHRGQGMMWSSPERMLAACRTWTGTDNGSETSSPEWCDDMVTWMSQHWNGDWTGMMNGSMMGGSGT